jgi:hypothetical protein
MGIIALLALSMVIGVQAFDRKGGTLPDYRRPQPLA